MATLLTFLKESLQLLYYAYFKPSALQARLNETAPQKEGDTTFLQLSLAIEQVTSARRFLLQCAFWWLLGLIPFWRLTWGVISLEGMLFISGALLLTAWGIAALDSPLGLAFPLLSGIAWGLKPELWTVLQTSPGPWPNWLIVSLLTADLILGMALGTGVAVWATASGQSRLTAWLTGLAMLIVGVVAGLGGDVVGFLGSVSTGFMASVAVTNLAGVLEAIVVICVVIAEVIFVLTGGLTVVGGLMAVFAAGIVVGIVVGNVMDVVVGVMTGAVVGLVAGVASVIMATTVVVFVTGSATLPWPLALGFALGLGMVFSPRLSLRVGLVLTLVVAALFVPQGWDIAGSASLSFLVGYFRLLPYLVALLATATVAGQLRFRSTGANALARRLPPFTDEIVWLPLFGLDRILAAAVKEDAEHGRKAVNYVATSFRQEWAVPAAWLQLSVQALTRCKSVENISDGPQEFAWLPDEPDQSLRGVLEVRRRLEEIARQVKGATSATSDYTRLRRLIQAQASVNNLRQSFAALKDRASQRFIPVAEHWDHLISDEIARLSAEEEIKADVPNPYITGIPVQPDEETMFAPRLDLLREVENVLNTLHGKPTLALYGPRRMGKTTFLLHLPRLLPDDVVPIFVDLQAAVQVSGLGGLYYNWATAACDAARDRRRLEVHPISF